MFSHDLDYSSNEAQDAFVLTVEASFIIYYLQSVHSDITSFGTCNSFVCQNISKETEAQGSLPVLGPGKGWEGEQSPCWSWMEPTFSSLDRSSLRPCGDRHEDICIPPTSPKVTISGPHPPSSVGLTCNGWY